MAGRMLIVDDEKNIRMTLRKFFEAEGYEVSIAMNGDEAVKSMVGNDFDIVLLDLKMPGMDGIEVLKKTCGMGKKHRVAMMTAYGTVERAVEAMKLGACDFISKPFTPEEIKAVVDDIVKRRTLDEQSVSGYKDMLGYAKKCINELEFQKAHEYLKKALLEDVGSAEVHNLLGVLIEKEGEVHEAQKHYRAALAFDPAYKPADDNLRRTVQFRYTRQGINLGDEERDETDEQ